MGRRDKGPKVAVLTTRAANWPVYLYVFTPEHPRLFNILVYNETTPSGRLKGSAGDSRYTPHKGLKMTLYMFSNSPEVIFLSRAVS